MTTWLIISPCWEPKVFSPRQEPSIICHGNFIWKYVSLTRRGGWTSPQRRCIRLGIFGFLSVLFCWMISHGSNHKLYLDAQPYDANMEHPGRLGISHLFYIDYQWENTHFECHYIQLVSGYICMTCRWGSLARGLVANWGISSENFLSTMRQTNSRCGVVLCKSSHGRNKALKMMQEDQETRWFPVYGEF